MTPGTCQTISGAPVGGRAACATDGSGCGGACNGVNPAACAYPASSCRSASCSAGIETHAANCNGAGACPAPVTVPCTPYICGPTACKTTCAADADCIAADYCNGTTCVPKIATGGNCSENRVC